MKTKLRKSQRGFPNLKPRQVMTQNGITEVPIRCDFGCGPNKKKTDSTGQPQAWIGVDCISFPGVDVVLDIAKDPWPWPDNSVEEAHASHFLEHLEAKERWHFMNELYRVLKPSAKATIITPDWSSQRAYGDMTHKWPPVSGFFWFYLSHDWRVGNPNTVPPQPANAPHTDAQFVKGGLNCNFAAQWGPTVHHEIACKHQEVQQFAITFYKEACQDMVCTLTKA